MANGLDFGKVNGGVAKVTGSGDIRWSVVRLRRKWCRAKAITEMRVMAPSTTPTIAPIDSLCEPDDCEWLKGGDSDAFGGKAFVVTALVLVYGPATPPGCVVVHTWVFVVFELGSSACVRVIVLSSEFVGLDVDVVEDLLEPELDDGDAVPPGGSVAWGRFVAGGLLATELDVTSM